MVELINKIFLSSNVIITFQVIPVPNEKADDLKGHFMQLGSEKNMEFEMLDEEKDLKQVSYNDSK